MPSPKTSKNFSLPRLIPTFLLILIIAFGAFLRLYKLESRLSFDYDNEFFAWEAKKIIVDHNFTLIGQESSFFGIFIGPLYTYLSTFFYWLFNLDPVGAGYLSIIFGISATLVLYKIGALVISPSAGLLAGFLYQVSLSTINWDLGASAISGMYLLPALWLYTLLKLPDIRYFLLHFLIIGLSFHFHPSSIILLLSSISLVPFIVKITRDTWRLYLSGILLFVLTFLPLILFEIRNRFMIIGSLFKYLDKSGDGGSVTILSAWQVVTNGLLGWVSFNDFSTMGRFAPIFAMAVIITYLKVKYPPVRKIIAIYFVLSFITFLSLLGGHKISDYYSMVTFAPTLVISALIIFQMLRHSLLTRILTIIFLVWFLSINLQGWWVYEKNFNLSDKKTAVRLIIDHSKKRRFQLSDSLIKLGYNTGYAYLFWLNKANIDNQNPQIIYSLVIPPDYLGTKSLLQTNDIGIVYDNFN